MANEAIQQAGQAAPEIDPGRVQLAMDRMRGEQNLTGALVAGAVAAAIGAALWAVVTVVTHYQIGWMAIGIGFLVGYAVRTAGKGVDPIYGVAGAGLALVGCAIGNLLAVCGMVAIEEGVPFVGILANLSIELVEQLMIATFSPMDLLFYGLAGYEGYKLSFRQITAQEITTVAPV